MRREELRAIIARLHHVLLVQLGVRAPLPDRQRVHVVAQHRDQPVAALVEAHRLHAALAVALDLLGLAARVARLRLALRLLLADVMLELHEGRVEEVEVVAVEDVAVMVAVAESGR